uniref:Uncharacterized protein MANES_10G129800 n=1 Tax=Rhizophora mucronata TaxID=61149 RepID=A0A2P2KTI5_RHIMU
MGSPFSSPLAAASSSSTAPPPPQPQPLWHSVGPPQMQKVGPTPINLFTTVSSFSYSLPLAASLLQSYNFKGINFVELSKDLCSSTWSCCLCFFNGRESRTGSENDEISLLGTSRPNLFNDRKWTSILLAINILVYVAQLATDGKLLMWGAKINSLIDKGQLWRLATSSFLHANIGHLMVNCYSLNSVGPSVEKLNGSRRFLAVYFASAVASSAASYWFCKQPAVGASGAIFGLVGSLAVYVIRHRGMIRNGKEDLQHIASVIFLNMVIGVLSQGIDNWGHLGGLLGGVAVSWLLGPVWKYEAFSKDGRRGVFVDRAPIKHLTDRNRKPRNLT